MRKIAVLLAAFALAACSSTHPANNGAPVAAYPVTASHHGQAVVYVVAAARWTAVPLPHPPADDTSVAGHGTSIYAAQVTSSGVALDYSRDGGRTWQARHVTSTTDLSGVDVTLDTGGTRLAVTLDRPGSAGAVGQASVLVGAASGGAFTAHEAPAAGQVAWWHGRLVLSGGALSSRLYLSDAAGSRWAAVPVEGTVAPERNVDPATPSVGAGRVLPDGSLLVPVTDHASTPRVDLQTTTDGSTFRSLGHVTLSGQLGAGVSAPVATLPDGSIVVSDPNTVRFTVVSGSTQRSFAPVGLPAPPSTLTFATPSLGLAQVEQAGCSLGKTGCSVRTDVFQTGNGGRSWTLAP